MLRPSGKSARDAVCSLALLVLLACPVSSMADTTGDTAPSSDQIFDEIELTPDGVTARDTAGGRWRYDFRSESFKPGRKQRSSNEYVDGRDRVPSSSNPVEIRCTEELKIDDDQNSVVVEIDEYVDGDIGVLGKVTIRGWVKGSVQSNSRVRVMESGQVDGDIRAPKIQVKDGAVVLGRMIETNPLVDLQDDMLDYSRSLSGVWVIVGFAVTLLLVGLLVLTLVPVKFERINACIAGHTIRSYLLGFLFTILMPMIMLLVIITIVGIFVVWLVPLAFLAAYFLGLVSVCGLVGRRLVERFVGLSRTQLTHYLAGLGTLILLWLVVAVLLGSPDEVSFGFGIFFLVLAIILTHIPIMAGAGAVFLTRFGFRDYISFDERAESGQTTVSVPAPPPIDSEPAILPPRPSPGAANSSHTGLSEHAPTPRAPGQGPPPVIIPSPPPPVPPKPPGEGDRADSEESEEG